jgi:hypothetical protein
VAGDQPRGGHVEREVRGRAARRRDQHLRHAAGGKGAGHVSDLARRAHLDRNLGDSVQEPPIDGGRRGRHIEGYLIVGRGQRLQIGPYLVRRVARARDTVGADNAKIDLAMLHQVTAGVVDDDRVVDPLLSEFERGQGGALVSRTRLVHPDMHGDAALLGNVDRGQGRSPVHRRQPAGIAVREDIDRSPAVAARGRFYERGAVLADRPTGGNVLLGDARGLRARRFCPSGGREDGHDTAYPLDRPGQIDRRRTRGPQQDSGVLEAEFGSVVRQRESEAPGGGHPDQRRSSHAHV